MVITDVLMSRASPRSLQGTVSTFVTLLLLPLLSVTVSVTVRGPLWGYVTWRSIPTPVGLGERPKSQL